LLKIIEGRSSICIHLRICKKFFGSLKAVSLLLQQFFITHLSRKAEGNGPMKALATLTVYSIVRRCQLHP
jgi:hypothetical protein